MKKNVYVHAAMAGLMAGSSLLATAARADEKKADPPKTPVAEKKGDKSACGGPNGCAGKSAGPAATAHAARPPTASNGARVTPPGRGRPSGTLQGWSAGEVRDRDLRPWPPPCQAAPRCGKPVHRMGFVGRIGRLAAAAPGGFI